MLNIFYRIPIIRERICRIRYYFLLRIIPLQIGETSNVLQIDYSKDAFKKYLSNKRRINFLIQLVKNNLKISKKSKVLSVGPRFESELYGLRGLGFKWRNIDAVDTYSYSPRISLGNMHNLVFKNKTFDLVVAGWVIAYSSDPVKAIMEFHRVLKPNGIAIITWELPMQYKIGSFKDFSLVRKKTTDDDYKILPPLNIFDLLVKTFQIQSFTCESLQPNPSPGLMTLVLRKIA